MDAHRDRQVAFNAASRDQWDGFAGHRLRVSTLLGAGRGRLCVLGAGNGNDLDLPALLAAYREVHLVDLDGEALAVGVAGQGVAGHPGLRPHGGLDVTGMLDAVSAWSPATEVGPAALAALAEWPAHRIAMALPGPFDVVASTCLLSQLIDNACHTLGEGHTQTEAVVRAIRAGHLRLLARLTAPGGSAVLISDVVSSDKFPPLLTTPEPGWAGLLPHLAREGNHIHGLHPAALLSALRRDPVLNGRVTDVNSAPPWRWQLHARHYLVWALTFRIGRGAR